MTGHFLVYEDFLEGMAMAAKKLILTELILINVDSITIFT